MQYLSLDDWKVAARLPIPAGELMLSRIRNMVGSRSEVKSTIRQSSSPRGVPGDAVGHLKPAGL